MTIKTSATTFWITGDPAWPSIIFTTDAPADQKHVWNFEITWGTFKKAGKAETPGNTWDAQSVLANVGGSLKVNVQVGTDLATSTVVIRGKQPTKDAVQAYLAATADADGFGVILEHESKMQHFKDSGEPIKSFDAGYGIAQLTTPAPSFEQCWNWKLNVDGGIELFKKKRLAAAQYLSQSGRTFTNDQLKREAVCRWNGGSYHVWDSNKNAWVRNPNILCDSKTGSIGWDMTIPENKGKTEAELHERDKASYAHAPKAGDHWKYSGVCYADSILR